MNRAPDKPDDEATSLEGIGECLLAKGDSDAGAAHLRQALEIFQRLGMHPDIARVQTRLAGLTAKIWRAAPAEVGTDRRQLISTRHEYRTPTGAGIRAGGVAHAQRVKSAVDLLAGGASAVDAARVLATWFGVSARQASRYVDQAASTGRRAMPQATVVFTVKLPPAQ